MFQPDLFGDIQGVICSNVLIENYLVVTNQLCNHGVVLVWKGNKLFVGMYSFLMQVTGNSSLKYWRQRCCQMFKRLILGLAGKVCGRRNIMLNLLYKLISISVCSFDWETRSLVLLKNPFSRLYVWYRVGSQLFCSAASVKVQTCC